MFEAHSTDYQTAAALAALVRDHFAILKVGPAVTFALREAVWALDRIEREWHGEAKPSACATTILDAMRADPRHWRKYYHASRARARSAAGVQPERPHPLLLAGSRRGGRRSSGCAPLSTAARRRSRSSKQYLPAAYAAVRAGDDSGADDRPRHPPHPAGALPILAGLRSANHIRRKRTMKTFPGLTAAVGACGLLLALQLRGSGGRARGRYARAARATRAHQSTQSNQSTQDGSNSTAGTGGTNSTSDTSDQLNEIVVTGISADLEKALDTKEFAPVMLDSIDSTELGRFPDADVADSLEHLPGITVSRTTGGEGQKITVQGLSSEYNIVTMDNRILASDDSGRDIAFDVLPAELITGADVLKSPQASAVEGSIGGTVNLHTASAFDNPGFHADAHGEGDWNDMSDLASKKFSAFISDTVADRTLGFVLGAVDTDLKSRTDSLNAYNQNIYGPISYPYPPDGVTPPAGSVPLVATPCCITFGSIFDDKKRTGLIGNLEWRPSDTFRLKADGLWTHLNDPQIGYNESYYFAANPNGTPFENNAVVQNGVITSVTVDNFQPEMVNNTINRKVDTFLYGLNGQWKPHGQPHFRRRPVSLHRQPPRGRPGHLRDRGPGERPADRRGHPQLHRRAQQPAGYQRGRAAEPARPVGLPRRAPPARPTPGTAPTPR